MAAILDFMSVKVSTIFSLLQKDLQVVLNTAPMIRLNDNSGMGHVVVDKLAIDRYMGLQVVMWKRLG